MQSWQPKFRRRIQLLVPAYIAFNSLWIKQGNYDIYYLNREPHILNRLVGGGIIALFGPTGLGLRKTGSRAPKTTTLLFGIEFTSTANTITHRGKKSRLDQPIG